MASTDAASVPNRAVALLLPSLEIGGAERQALTLARGLSARGWRVVMAYRGESMVRDDADGIRYAHLRAATLGDTVRELKSLLSSASVPLLHAYLRGSQAQAVLARLTGWGGRLILDIRDSLPVLTRENARAAAAGALIFGASPWVDRYAFNSEAGRRAKAFLIPRSKQTVIFNGIDVERFRPDAADRIDARRAFGLADGEIAVGLVANASDYKDFPTFIDAAARVAAADARVRFTVIGDVETTIGRAAAARALECGLGGRITFAGPRLDVERWLRASDIGCCSSWTEGFPNAVAEQMATGIPCAVTEAGDAAMIVGDTGTTAPTRNAAALAAAVLALTTLPEAERLVRGVRARARIVDNFSIARMVEGYESLYASCLQTSMVSSAAG